MNATEYAATAERLTKARMAHYGYTPEQVAEAEALTHEDAGCYWENYQWVCTDEDDKPNHPVRDDLDAAAEWVCWVLDELAAVRAAIPEQTSAAVVAKEATT